MINSLIGVLFSLLSIWPIFNLLGAGYFMLFYILLNILVIPVYRYYINYNIFNFETERTPTTAVIKIFIYVINLILSIILFKVDLKLLLSFVGAYMCHVTYLYSIFDRTVDWNEGGILQVKNLTIRYISDMIVIQLVLKLIICVLLLVLEFDIHYISWISSFVIDLLIYSSLKRSRYSVRLFQEGFVKEFNELISSFWRLLTIGLFLFISLILARTPIFYPYRYIAGLFNREMVEVEPYESEHHTDVFQEQSNPLFDELIDDGYTPNPFLEDFWEVLSRILAVIIVLLIIRLFVVPLIVPFFKAIKRGEPIWKTLKRLFKELWLSLFFKKTYLKEGYNESGSIQKKREREQKKSIIEIYHFNTLVRYYNRLLSYIKNRQGVKIYTSSTVEEVFNFMDREKSDIAELETLFHKGFYSKHGVNKVELKEIKNYLKLLLKK